MRSWPILSTLRGYELASLGPDLLAGLTLVAVAVPEQMATARLAGMPPGVGLYAFIAGSVMFALLGRSPQVSVGADSTIAPIIAGSVATLAAVGSVASEHLISFLALLVGIVVIAVGALRCGWLAELFSTPVITGLLAGIAVEIALREIPSVLGLKGGGTTTIGRVETIANQIGHTNGWAVGIAVAVFAIVVVAERVDRRIPGALIGLIASTLLVAGVGLVSHGVPVVGSIHGGFPTFALPSFTATDFLHLVAPALTIAFVIVAQTAATVRGSNLSAQDFDADLMAIGAGSLLAGASGSFAVNASPPRTAVVTASGGRSQVAGLLAAAVVLVIALVATGLLKDLPKATLGAILVFVATRLFRVRVLKQVWRFSSVEFGLAAITGLAVVFLGIEQGVVLALVVSLGDRTRRAVRPADTVLGRETGTDHWIPVDIGQPTEQVPGVVVYLVYGALWYGNADHVRTRILDVIHAAPPPVHGFVLDANAVADVDFTGAQMLVNLVHELEKEGIRFVIARSSKVVHHNLRSTGLLARFGADRFCESTESAVERVGAPR